MKPATHVALALLILCSMGCGSEEPDAHVVVGLTTDLAVGFDFRRVEVTTKVDGAVTRAESLSYSSGDLSLPAELLVLPAQDGAEVELSIEAFRGDEGSPVVARRAATRAVSGRSVFLPVSLDEACAEAACAAGATCVGGACVDPFIDASALGEHDPAWIASAPDACKTPLSGEPVIELGQGESAFAPLQDSEEVPIEAGPQGGHHVWLALRVAGLRQMGSRLTVNGYFPDLALEVLPFSSHITLHRAGDGHCEIYGVRFQVDRGVSVEEIRGRGIDIEAVLEDPNGDLATAMKRVVIAP